MRLRQTRIDHVERSDGRLRAHRRGEKTDGRARVRDFRLRDASRTGDVAVVLGVVQEQRHAKRVDARANRHRDARFTAFDGERRVVAVGVPDAALRSVASSRRPLAEHRRQRGERGERRSTNRDRERTERGDQLGVHARVPRRRRVARFILDAKRAPADVPAAACAHHATRRAERRRGEFVVHVEGRETKRDVRVPRGVSGRRRANPGEYRAREDAFGGSNTPRRIPRGNRLAERERARGRVQGTLVAGDAFGKRRGIERRGDDEAHLRECRHDFERRRELFRRGRRGRYRKRLLRVRRASLTRRSSDDVQRGGVRIRGVRASRDARRAVHRVFPPPSLFVGLESKHATGLDERSETRGGGGGTVARSVAFIGGRDGARRGGDGVGVGTRDNDASLPRGGFLRQRERASGE